MNILITGTAGFIGAALAKKLLERGENIIGIDNHNNYYDPKLKEARIARINNYKNYFHNRADISNQKELETIFKKYKPQKVVNLAAQAGVRYSIENPIAYINSNIVGFANILENCRDMNVENLVYASTSSVYGANTNIPFSENECANHPLSVYAASKKSNELMAHAYSHLYRIPTTGLRFFSVYGPWGRPDMALFKFTKAILENKPIDIYNHGNHLRDFTYIDDIIEGIIRAIDNAAKPNLDWNSNKPDSATSNAPWCIYNIGNRNPIKLMEYICIIEKILGKVAKKIFLPLQAGDVPEAYSNTFSLEKSLNFKPETKVEEGIGHFIKWYIEYYKIKHEY
jgi:UDP-glucuronate 4-epimerase